MIEREYAIILLIKPIIEDIDKIMNEIHTYITITIPRIKKEVESLKEKKISIIQESLSLEEEIKRLEEENAQLESDIKFYEEKIRGINELEHTRITTSAERSSESVKIILPEEENDNAVTVI